MAARTAGWCFLSRLLLGFDVPAVRRRLNELILDGGHRILGVRREDSAAGRSRIVSRRCGARRLGRCFVGDRFGLITKRRGGQLGAIDTDCLSPQRIANLRVDRTELIFRRCRDRPSVT